MKKIIAFVLCSLILVTAVYPCAEAVSVAEGKEQFDDGSYLIVTYVKPPEETSGDDDGWVDIDSETEESESASFFNKIIKWFKDIISKLFAKQSSVTKTKYCNYYDSNGKLLWSVSLKGTFTYNHRKALCVSSEVSYEIRDKDWTMLSYDSSEENDTAKGEFSIRQYKLGVPLKFIKKELTLTCDKEGNVK